MRAAVYRGVNQVPCEEVPVPEISNGEVLVRIEVCGLCQSDIKKILYPLYEPPRIFGHEMAGVIEKVGPGVTPWQKGDRVVVLHHIPCLNCPHCENEDYSLCRTFKEVSTTAGFEPAGGGFAQFIKVPAHIVPRGILRIPADVSFEEATFVEPVNCCLKGMEKARTAPGQSVMVIGAGPMGLLFIQLLKHQGARPIAAELREDRRETALELGADLAINPVEEKSLPALKQFTRGLGPDVVLLAVPSRRATDFAMQTVRKGGTVLFFAEFPEEAEMPLNPNFLYRNEVTLAGSYSSSYKLLKASAASVFDRQVNVRALISDEFPLEDLGEAVQLATHPGQGTLKIMIRP